MYKDKDRQREANRKASQRARDRRGMTVNGNGTHVIPEQANIPTDKREQVTKRGKDIKCFEDLPPDVQRTIVNMSTIDGQLNKDEKAKRTARAVHYQSLFPDRYYSTGVGCAEPTGNPEIHDYDPDKPGLNQRLNL